jgi:hypothetical protein
MITFKNYTDIVNSIAKKLNSTKDAAVNALIKVQQKGIDPLKWQKHLTMLKTFLPVMADYDPTIAERQLSTPQKVQQMNYYWKDLDHLASDEMKKKKMAMKFGIKNIKLDQRGKILSFESVEEDTDVRTPRDYRKEYDNYHAQPEQRERNAARKRARRQMEKAGKVEKFDKMDVHHKDNNPLNNEEDNLAVTTQNWNRTEPRLRK